MERECQRARTMGAGHPNWTRVQKKRRRPEDRLRVKVISARIKRLHPHGIHQTAGKRPARGSRRDPLSLWSPFLTGITKRQVATGAYTSARRGAQCVPRAFAASHFFSVFLEVSDYSRGVLRILRFPDCPRVARTKPPRARQMSGLAWPETLSHHDGFHHYEFRFVSWGPGVEAPGHAGSHQVHAGQGVLFTGPRRARGPAEGFHFSVRDQPNTNSFEGDAEFSQGLRIGKFRIKLGVKSKFARRTTATPPHLHPSVPVQSQVSQGVVLRSVVTVCSLSGHGGWFRSRQKTVEVPQECWTCPFWCSNRGQ